ncbi:MAG TPA: MupA/Atu3671 family FMN-dependent luciferase-like monooxygenase [Polyangiaceae bacterium]
MANPTRFSCFILGTDALLTECGEILLGQGHDIRGIVSSAPRVVQWALGRGLTLVDPGAAYVEALRREPFDYLFAITHLAVIPDEVLSLPRKAAINFHDGPLPRYAGLNAPAWALMARESRYGVTWHLMGAKVDAGAILKQVTFEVAPDETSLSLNTKCFAVAIESFAELAAELAAGPVTSTPQTLEDRLYFGRYRRPEAACVIDWTRGAHELEALVRALDFGERHANQLGLAKIFTAGETLAVVRAEARTTRGGAPPGCVTSLDDDAIGVATGDGVLALLAFSTLDGRPVGIREASRRLGLEVGGQLQNLSEGGRERLSELDRRFARGESFWVERLGLEPVDAPYALPSPAEASRQLDIPLEIPEPVARALGDATSLMAALGVYCSRMSHKEAFSIALRTRSIANDVPDFSKWIADTVPLSIHIDHGACFGAVRDRIASELEAARGHGTYLQDVVARYPELRHQRRSAGAENWAVCVAIDAEPLSDCVLSLVVPSEGHPRLRCDTSRIPEDKAKAIARELATFLEAATRGAETPVGKLALVGEQERNRLLVEYNRTLKSYPEACIHHLIEEQAARTPHRAALAFEDDVLSYRELNERANRLAGHLRSLGVGPDELVGLCVERSLELVVAALGILKAGGAYVPLDPRYPVDRIAFMLDDANVRVVVVEDESRAAGLGLKAGTHLVRLDADRDAIARQPARDLEGGPGPENLAYVIYTSGSTGTPKGVMVEHRNVVNFFAGMDERIVHDPPGTWLAVTSLSFDISVLELFWPLTRGFKVVIHGDRDRDGLRPPVLALRNRAIDFSLFYFASDEAQDGEDKYQLLLEGAKFADEHGFSAVWTPERHFHAFGGLYPNPAVTGAALAVLTKNVQIRAGSVVLPLHHPARVAEAWSVVDNLSHGRVGISFASGWQPNDFVLRPEAFKDAKAIMFRDVEVVKSLWRGEAVPFPGPSGAPVPVRTLPRPLQRELPTWITTAGNVETYKKAGEIGANVLTHLLGQTTAELAPKIEAYRAARREHGHDPDAGVVSLMLHAFVGDDDAAVRAAVREPLKRYLGSSLELLKHYAWAFPAFSRPKDSAADAGDDLAHLSDDERDALLEHAFTRYYETSGLFGRPEGCLRLLDELAQMGVDEIACLIDFGVPTALVLEHLRHLERLRKSALRRYTDAGDADDSIAAAIRRHQVTHFQCTPSMARMLLDDPDAREALGELRFLLVGGEAMPIELARTLRSATGARILNMYGPTETTVWSTVHELNGDEHPVPIGRPIANTRVYVLDAQGEPVPEGAPGELFIGGEGVARGYLGRDELTRQRFLADPFARVGRMYRTGDVARFREGGVLEFLGRRDHQIKIRGHRVELGEIEAAVDREPGVRECAVVLREDVPGDQRLVAYVAARQPLDEGALRSSLRARLPEFMVPSHIVTLAELPRTPNRKIDRKALPAPDLAEASAAREFVAPKSDMETTIAQLWQEVLGRDGIDIDDNFFDVGGHSLLIVRMHQRLRELVSQPVTLTDLYRFPTIRLLADFLTAEGSSSAAQEGTERAEKRREMSMRRRTRQLEG